MEGCLKTKKKALKTKIKVFNKDNPWIRNIL